MTDLDNSTNLRPYYDKYSFEPYPGYNSLSRDGVLDSSGSSGVAGRGFFQSTTNKLQISSPSIFNSTSRGSQELFMRLDTDISMADTYAILGMSMLRNYGKILSSQPFENSRILLQIADWPSNSHALARDLHADDKRTGSSNDHSHPDVSDDEAEYFTSPIDQHHGWTTTKDMDMGTDIGPQYSPEPGPKHRDDPSQCTAMWKQLGFRNTLTTDKVQLFDIMFSIVNKDGLKGLWRGFHTTFVYEVLLSTSESWISGFLSAVMGIPDPSFVDVIHSPYPLLSLAVTTASSVLATLLVAPIDIMRMKFLVTNFTGQARSFRKYLMKVKTFSISSELAVPTALFAGLPAFIRHGTPYFLYAKFGIDSKKNPTWYNLLSLMSTMLEVFVKVPLETLMRRSQVATLQLSPDEMLVAPAPYEGVLGSIWNVLIGQDHVESYFRGWRMSLSGALGDWGLEALRNDDRTRERF